MQEREYVVGLRLTRGDKQNCRHAKRPKHQEKIHPAILIKQPARDLPYLRQIRFHRPLHSRNRSSKRRRSGMRLTISPPDCHTASIARRCSDSETAMRNELEPALTGLGSIRLSWAGVMPLTSISTWSDSL